MYEVLQNWKTHREPYGEDSLEPEDHCNLQLLPRYLKKLVQVFYYYGLKASCTEISCIQ